MRDDGDDRSVVRFEHRPNVLEVRRANGDSMERSRCPIQGRWMGQKGPRGQGRRVMGKVKDLAIDDANAVKSRRGRRARARGNSFELEVARRLGGGARRTGWMGTKVDVEAPGWLVAQCKVGGSFPERIDGWLRSLPSRADQLRVVILGDSPGAGVKRRTLVVLDLDDFVSWYGNPEESSDAT